jgi:hypothetical protein
VALDRALEALADPDPGDLDLVAGLEHRNRDGLALERPVEPAAELDDRAVSADAEPLQVPELGPRHLPIGHRIERELHALVAVGVDGPHLDDRARPGRDHGHGRDGAGLLVEDLRHA